LALASGNGRRIPTIAGLIGAPGIMYPICRSPVAHRVPIDAADRGPTHPSWEPVMSSIAKVIEVIAESETSWDDAVKNALAEAARTVDDIREIWVSGMKAIVENNNVVRYRITAKITFVLKPTR
jgi:flavin-binding protein dodecin